MKTKLLVYLSLIITLSILLTSCKKEKKFKKEPITYKEISTQTISYCDPIWFPHSQTPPPSEGDGSPFDQSTSTNLIFHQWSWQKFLWLTKPMKSGKVLFEEEYNLVNNQMVPVSPVDSIHLVLTDTSQAGSGGILMSSPSFTALNKSETVYYSIYTNDILQKASDSLKTVMLNDTTLLNNKFIFPIGAVELKVSWIKTTAIPDSQIGNYYTTEAYISPTAEKTKVALLGMHVTGVVKNHPEFIWATFEHNYMTPLYDWTNTTNKDVPVTSSNEKLFFKEGATATIADISWPKGTKPAPKNVFGVYKYGVPRVAGNGFMKTPQQEPANYNNIDSINTCVAVHLKDVWKNYFYNGSTWLNTDGMTPAEQANTLVKLGGSIGNVAKDTLLRGSTGLSNITMETYTQIFNTPIHTTNINGLANCFSCHSSIASIAIGGNTKSYTSPLYLSHIFRSYLNKSSGLSKEEIETIRLQEFIDLLNIKAKE